MNIELECLKELEYRVKRLLNLFDFKTDEALNRYVSHQNTRSFDVSLNKMISPANELKFITKEDNQVYAKEIFNNIQKLFNKSNNLLAKGCKNEDIKELVDKYLTEVDELVYVIKNNEQNFKQFCFEESQPFDQSKFIDIADKLKIKNKNKEEKVKFFQTELNGGSVLNNFIESLYLEGDPMPYGVDISIDEGYKSREKGINTARGGLLSSSSKWVDVALSSNNSIYFGKEKSDISFSLTKTDYEKIIQRNLMNNKSLLIFNAPFYHMNLIEKDIGHLNILSILNADDQYGNLIFIVDTTPSNAKRNRDLLLQAQFAHHTLPKELKEVVVFEAHPTTTPANFRARYVDMDDIRFEFNGEEPSSTFIFDKCKLENSSFSAGRPLQEPKEGHIPTLATSGIVSGRYVDEILKEKVGEKIGFDNIIETKIIKREIEEEEEVEEKGETLKEISLKKSNIIVSTALTPTGEFIELFSNETEE